MPRAIADQIHDCVWVPWKKGTHHPGLILGPFDISGETAVSKEVGKMIETAMQKNQPELWNRHLVFWYSAGFSLATGGAQKTYTAFTLENPDDLVPYSEGVELGYDRPKILMSKMDAPSLLTYRDDMLWNGIQQMKKDAVVEKQERGGPFFFKDQMDSLREAAKRSNDEREEKMKQKQIENARKREERRLRDKEAGDDTKFLTRFVGNGICSLELCSGKGIMTEGLRKAGVAHRITHDFDHKKPTDSDLSLEQLHDMMQVGDHRCRHHKTQKCWNAIFAAPDCSTYSIAQSTKLYRTEDYIYGVPFLASEREAREADDDIDHLVEILLEFQSMNRHHRRPPPIICIENPDGYLPKHPISKRFSAELDLVQVKISYCMFGSKENPLPQKNTVLWTNSPSLIAAFKDGKYFCKKDCKCLDSRGNHIVGVQNYSDRCAAYPVQMADFVSNLMAKDARAIASARTK